jgi:hypothetical protein
LSWRASVFGGLVYGQAYRKGDISQSSMWLNKAAAGGYDGAAAEPGKICAEKPGVCENSKKS